MVKIAAFACLTFRSRAARLKISAMGSGMTTWIGLGLIAVGAVGVVWLVKVAAAYSFSRESAGHTPFSLCRVRNMNKTMLTAAFMTAFMLADVRASEPTPGTFINGQTLHDDCRAYVKYDRTGDRPSLIEADQIAACQRTVLITADAVAVISNAYSKPNLFCLPSNIIASTAVDVVVKWMEDNPSARTYPAVVVAMMALKDAYPCR